MDSTWLQVVALSLVVSPVMGGSAPEDLVFQSRAGMEEWAKKELGSPDFYTFINKKKELIVIIGCGTFGYRSNCFYVFSKLNLSDAPYRMELYHPSVYAAIEVHEERDSIILKIPHGPKILEIPWEGIAIELQYQEPK